MPLLVADQPVRLYSEAGGREQENSGYLGTLRSHLFWPQFTREFLGELRRNGVPFANAPLPCGHYSLGVSPFSYVVGYRFGRFLSSALLPATAHKAPRVDLGKIGD